MSSTGATKRLHAVVALGAFGVPGHGRHFALSMLAKIRYAPGTPAGNSRNHE